MRLIAVDGEDSLYGYLQIVSLLLIVLLGYFGIRWLRIVRLWRNLRTMISLTFGLYALFILSTLVIGLAAVAELFINPPPWSSSRFALSYSITMVLALIFGLSLLKVSTTAVGIRELGSKSMLMSAICLASYGTMPIVNLVSAGSPSIGAQPGDLLVTFYWIRWLATLIEHGALLLLSVDTLLKRSLRRRSICMVVLSVGISWMMQYVPALFSSATLLECIHACSLIAASFIAIMVSYSLIQEGRFEGRKLVLSSAAIFLYSAAFLLTDLHSIFSFTSVMYNSLINRVDWTHLIYRIWETFPLRTFLHIAHLIALLAIGLYLLERGRTNGVISA